MQKSTIKFSAKKDDEIVKKQLNLVKTTICDREPGDMSKLVEKFMQMKDLEGQNMRNLYGGTFDNRLKNIDIDESAVTYNRLSLPAYKKHLSSLFSSQP